MSRPIVLSNGQLHVGLNKFGLVHDFYYPYVGLENHSAGQNLRHRVGIWIDGNISWLDEDTSWDFSFKYPQSALISHTTARHQELGVILEFDDMVDSRSNAFIRNIHIINLRSEHREIRLFLHQAFVIGDSRSNTDTAQYLPDSDAILHYRGRRVFIVSSQEFKGLPFDQYTVGLFGIEGREGTYRDADDGELSFCNVEHGRVDSTLRHALTIAPNSSARVHYWIAAGKSLREALSVHKELQEHVHVRMHDTADDWRRWLKPAFEAMSDLPGTHREAFLKSTMIVKSQIDARGAVIASTDTTMLNYSRDAYGYCWPRDGAYVVWPLIRMGYTKEPLNFFKFCKKGMHPSGYLMHKYRADGAVGSSWHPYQHGDTVAAPIQEDETALVAFVFAQYCHAHPDESKQLLEDYYEDMIIPMAEFLCGYIDPLTRLPKPSYDLWEEKFITSTYTIGTVYGGLMASADLADMAGDPERAVKFRTSAEDIKSSSKKHLMNSETNYFIKGLYVNDGDIEYDTTFDCASWFGCFMFGLYTVDSDELRKSISTLEDRFGVSGAVTGLPRYEDDPYRRSESGITGNYWFICSLWLAQYYLEVERIDDAMRIVDWVKDQMLSTGMLAEQFDPVKNEAIAPAPLTWSHAEYLATLLDMRMNNEVHV